MDRFSELEAFAAVVDAQSFSGAARKLGVSKSYVSKRISALEERLGTMLLQRTTRQLQITDSGAVFYEHAVRILEEMEEAESAVGALHTQPRGTLRVSVPVSFGVRYVSPVAMELMRRYPELNVELSCSDRIVNLIDEGFDMAVRIGALQDSTMIARRLAYTERVVCASPAYLEEHGTPERPEELSDHRCLLYAYKIGGPTWTFTARRGSETQHVKVQGQFVANHGDVLLEAVRNDLGVALLPEFFVYEDLAAGRLVRLFDGWTNNAGGVWAVYPQQRHLALKVRLFVDMLVERFADVPWCAER